MTDEEKQTLVRAVELISEYGVQAIYVLQAAVANGSLSANDLEEAACQFEELP